MKKLPIGIQNFTKLIRGGFAYVDKTKLIYRLVTEGEAYFFARPRRFGKSLLLSTLAALFAGQKELFSGLWIEGSDFEWAEHPVLALDFSTLVGESKSALLDSLNRYLQRAAQEQGVVLDLEPWPSETFSVLLRRLFQGREVVVLIDEYDRALVKNIEDPRIIKENRAVLQDFFAVLKQDQKYIRFTFVTGVSKFSQVSLFSGMNSLDDISLHPEYTTLTGIVEQEIWENFAPQLRQLAENSNQSPEQLMDCLRLWYNGYRFGRSPNCERVFNPWSLLKFLSSGELQNYWFTSGTPTFAIKLIKEQELPLMDLDRGIQAGDELESNHEIDGIDLPTLLFQTGYLTIESYDPQERVYSLVLPNEEVRRSLLENLFLSYSGQYKWRSSPHFADLRRSLEEGAVGSFFEHFNSLLAAIPYPAHVARESYYQSLLYLCLRMLGFLAEAEVMMNQGRIDLAVELPRVIYVFELKIDQSAQEALNQIRRREYGERYSATGKKIVLIGANFSSKTRSVSDWVQATS
jgi:hypothetical protein